MSLTDLARRSPFLLWTAALIGIFAWMVHIMAVAGITQYTCNQHGTLWTMHVATVALSAVTAAGTWICWSLVKSSDRDDSDGTLAGNHVFVGVFGVITGGFSLALILLEGSYALFLSPCA